MNVTFTEAYLERYADIPFGIACVWECDAAKGTKLLADYKSNTIIYIGENRDDISRAIGHYERFFKNHGSQCPLRHQLGSVLQKGFPSISPYVEILLLNELKNGVLMGIQDLDKIKGDLIMDIAQQGEQFEGFRRRIKCQPSEIIVRDSEGIVASYFQGPDKKTSVSDDTKNIILYAFFAPGIQRERVQKAIEQATELLHLYSNNKMAFIKIYEPNA